MPAAMRWPQSSCDKATGPSPRAKRENARQPFTNMDVNISLLKYQRVLTSSLRTVTCRANFASSVQRLP